MKKTLVMLLVSVGLLFLAGCAKDYPDVKAFLQTMTKAVDDFAAAVEKVQSAAELAAAMNSFCDVMEKCGKDAEAIKQKYPELKDTTPPSLKADLDKMMASAQKLQSPTLQEKVKNFAMDKGVQEAAMRMLKVGTALQAIGGN